MRVVLGNRHAHVNDEKLPRGKRATVIDFPDGHTLGRALRDVTDLGGVWTAHATDGATPAWVASDSPAMAQLLAEHFGGIQVRDLEDPYQGAYDHTEHPSALPAAIAKGASAVLGVQLALAIALFLVSKATPWLRTNAGADFQAKQMAGAASATAVAKWVAVTANTTAPAAGDTTLTGEITTAGGGLVRQAGTYAHTTGTASYTLTTTFTANGSDALPVTLGKRGIFDAASGGNLVFETLISPTATLSASGDAVTLTDTVTL